MNLILTIFMAIVVFSVIILIHELGHFGAAKMFGITVNEFAIGMGPILYKRIKGGTQYSLRLIPMGGFVSMEGEDEESGDPHAFCAQKTWKKIIVVAAGAIMNLILGFLVVIIILSMRDYLGSTTVVRFEEGATSSQSLQIGDKILKINGATTHVDNDIIYALLRDSDGLAEMVVERNGEKMTIEVPFLTKQLETGTTTISIDFKVLAVEKTFFGVLTQSYYWTVSIAKQVWLAIFDLVTGHFNLNQLSGPVGTATAIGQATTMGLPSLLMIVAFITINLGIFNILPLPALDGGRLLFLFIEAIRRKPILPKYEGYIHAVGFLLLIGLMVTVTYNDIVKLFIK